MKPNPRVVVPVLLGVVIVAAVVNGLVQRARDRGPLVASGTVEATEARLGFQVTGRIAAVNAREGDLVKAGSVLASLDPAETDAKRDQARAQVAAAEAQLLELRRGFRKEEVAQGKAALDAARQRYDDAKRDLDRTTRLRAGGAVSQEAADKSQTALDLAKSALAQAEDQWRILSTGPRRERVEAAQAQVEQARAAVRALDAQVSNMTVRAPFDGVVTVRYREPGETAPAGSPVLSVLNRGERWVRIYVPETRIAAVRLGEQATITTDTDPGKRYGGTVSYIASEAEFTPKTVQTREERVKLVYAVKVRIDGDPSYDLKPGMPADVRLALPGR
ncbi:MAG: HlyD family secretion protein [Bacteroidota bacterium]